MTYEQCERARRLAGLCGGVLLFFSVDMLFYGYFGAGADFADGMRAP